MVKKMQYKKQLILLKIRLNLKQNKQKKEEVKTPSRLSKSISFIPLFMAADSDMMPRIEAHP